MNIFLLAVLRLTGQLFIYICQKTFAKSRKRPDEIRVTLHPYSSGLAHYLLCGDSLSTNVLQMKADCDYSFTDRTLNFYNALRVWIRIE